MGWPFGGGPSQDTSMGQIFRPPQGVNGGGPSLPKFETVYQRIEFFSLDVVNTGVRVSKGHQPIDGLFLQSVSSNANIVYVGRDSLSQTAMFELSPGQVFSIEIENSRSIVTDVLKLMGIGLRRVCLDSYEWILSGTAGNSVRVMLAYKSEEGY